MGEITANIGFYGVLGDVVVEVLVLISSSVVSSCLMDFLQLFAYGVLGDYICSKLPSLMGNFMLATYSLNSTHLN